MSCRCPIQPDYCVDEPVTEIDCWECPTCRISMTAVDLGIVLRHKDRLIERLHATRSTLMEERNSAMVVADELRRQLTGKGSSIILPWETQLWAAHDSSTSDIGAQLLAHLEAVAAWPPLPPMSHPRKLWRAVTLCEPRPPHPLRRRLPPDEIRKTIDNTRQILANAKARRAHDHARLRAESEARHYRSA